MQAVAKFWETPELLGELFSFLDLKSALSLARVLDKDVLKRSLSSKVFRRLVNRGFDGVGILDWTGLDPETDYRHRTYRDETLDVAQKLATMLKIANTPKTLLMDTLNLILQKHPPTRIGVPIVMLPPPPLPWTICSWPRPTTRSPVPSQNGASSSWRSLKGPWGQQSSISGQ